MRCTTPPMTHECPARARCEIEGCLHPYGPPTKAIATTRQPIDLPYQPAAKRGGLLGIMNRGTIAVQITPPAAPPPAAAIPAPEPSPMPPSPPPPPAPDQASRMPDPPLNLVTAPVRVIEVPGPGWLIYYDGRLLGLTLMIEQAELPR